MVYPGIDNLASVHAILQGKRIGLMTNPTGVDHLFRSTIDILHETYGLSALFGCEHGVRGDAQAGSHVSSAPDPDTGVMVYSLFGGSFRMSDEMLDAFDVFVYDMQDVGARFYTYLYSLSYAMEACARTGKTVIVLDRPNPLGCEAVQGTLLDETFHSFVGEYAIPTRYGLTPGEYALWVRNHLHLDLDLHVAPMLGYRRSMRYADTGLSFVPPSPNCATLHAADLYTGTCIFEGANISEGRGTVLPFEYIGAPYIDAARLEKRMNDLHLPGVMFRRAFFTPMFSKYAHEQCRGVQIHLTDPRVASPFAIGIHLMEAIRDLHPADFRYLGHPDQSVFSLDHLLGTQDFRLGRMDAHTLIETHRPLVQAWQEQSRSFWLYD